MRTLARPGSHFIEKASVCSMEADGAIMRMQDLQKRSNSKSTVLEFSWRAQAFDQVF